MFYIRASVDTLCRDGAGEISCERLQHSRLIRQGTTSLIQWTLVIVTPGYSENPFIVNTIQSVAVYYHKVR